MVLCSYTVLFRNNLTENAFGTRSKKAFRLRSIRVPFAFQSVPICVPLLLERVQERVPVTLVIRSDIIGHYRDSPSNVIYLNSR